MNELPDSQAWQILGGRATWRAGFAYGVRYPSLEMTIQGEELTEAERDTLSSGLIAALPAPALAGEWAERTAESDGSGTGEIARLMLMAIMHLQQGAGLPVFNSGRILLQDGCQTRILIPTSAGSYQLIYDLMNWLVRACGELRAGRNLEDHAIALPPLTAQLQSHHGTHSVSFQFVAAALRAGIPVFELPEGVVQYGEGHLARRLQNSVTDETASTGVHLARLKHCAAQVMSEAGIPVPRHQLVFDETAALRAAEEIGYPVVVKPADLDGGLAVSADIRTAAEVSKAFTTALAKSKNILIEKHMPGQDYRVTVYRGEVIWAVERMAGGVTGDGLTTVAELIERLNRDPRRQAASHMALKPLPLDDEAISLLQRDGLTVDSVPAAGQFVRLRRAANIASGGLPVAVFDIIHPDNAQLAVRAAAALGLDLAGVDLLIPDIAQSWLETGASICEINAGPDLGQTTAAHLYGPILASLVKGTGRIPIILIVGAAPDSLLDNLIAEGLNLPGITIGYHDRRGVRTGNERLTRGPVDNFIGGRILIRDRRVGAIIMQVNDDSLLESGLPFPQYDLLVIAGDDLAAAKPERDRPGAAIAADLIPALLPACDGKVVQLTGSGLAMGQFRQMTRSSWEGPWTPAELKTFLRSEIKRLAEALQAPLEQSA